MNRASFDAPGALTHVLESTGYCRDGEPLAGLTSFTDVEKRIRYAALIDRLKPSAIYEISGSPCFYFKWVEAPDPDPEHLFDLHRIAWNNGLAPVLWVITPAKVLLYNCFSKPRSSGNADSALIQAFENTAAGLLALEKIAGRQQVESGEFWSATRAGKIDRKDRIDAALLRDISATEERLTRANLNKQSAHSLIMRSIFLAYLQHRGILTSEFLKTEFGVGALTEILATQAGASDLFRWLTSTFNGDLFASEDLPVDQGGGGILGTEQLEIVCQFLSGAEMTSGQQRFWPYDFSVIPIELISSIYERFAYSGNASVAKQQSTHYTPINLVDIVLSQAFSHPKPEALVLDMACGSGVFLVESLRRIVGQRVAAGEPWTRETVRRSLYDQIFGIDVNPEAIRIAMFSLYLTVLELDPNPQPPTALRFKPLIGHNLVIGNAFPEKNARADSEQPFIGKHFDVIVGNPPWSRRAENRSPADYCEARGLPLARLDTPDQAFLWRALDFANPRAVIGMILHGKPFFSHTSDADAVRRQLIRSFKPKLLMNLAGLRKEGLFPKSKAPALILIAEVGKAEKEATAVLVAPRRDRSFRNHGIVEIEGDDVREIDVQSIGTDQDLLKVASWGAPRDLQLIRRLRSYPSLGELLKEAKPRGWAFGQGLQLAGGQDRAPWLEGKPFLQSGRLPAFDLDHGCLETFGKQLLHRPRDPKIYRGPLVVTPRGLDGPSFRAAFCGADLVYSEVYYGIAVPNSEEPYAHFLNAILNSELASYFLFMTASSWGVERDEVKPEDLLRLPIPKIKSLRRGVLRDLLSLEKKLRSGVRPDLLRALNDAVCDVYDIDEAERFLIDDLVQNAIPAWYTGLNDSARASEKQVQAYADVVLRVINSLLSVRDERKLIAEPISDASSRLCVLRLRTVSKKQGTLRNGKEPRAALGSVLSKIQASLSERHSSFAISRVIRLYTEDDVYIVKPTDQRYWTRSKALADADAIIAEHIRAR